MKLLVGLGNPGDKYKGTRHNVGFMFLDHLATTFEKHDWEKDKFTNALVLSTNELFLAKPLTFMNSTGLSVSKLLKKEGYKTQDLCIIHDDLDIALGEYKTQFGKGPKVHNGVVSIENSLKTTKFWRIRIGVDNRLGKPISGEDYVLSKFAKDEQTVLDKVIQEIIKENFKND